MCSAIHCFMTRVIRTGMFPVINLSLYSFVSGFLCHVYIIYFHDNRFHIDGEVHACTRRVDIKMVRYGTSKALNMSANIWHQRKHL